MFKKKRKEKRIENLSNSEVRAIWAKRKTRLYWKMSLIFSVIIITGIELFTSNYSLISEVLEGTIARSSLLIDIIENIDTINEKYAFLDKDFISLGKKSIKLLFAIALASIGFHFFCFKDPFNNHELLRNYHIQRPKKKAHFFYREIGFYAKHLPSNILADICEACSDRDECQQRIPIQGDKKTNVWSQLFALFDPVDVDTWHRITNDCRTAYFWKYGLLFSSIFLLLVFFLLMFISSISSRILFPSLFAVPLIITCVFGFIFFSFVHKTEKNCGGSWRRFREHSKSFFQSDGFSKLHVENLCYKASSENDLETFRQMNKFLSYLVEDKLLRHCCGINERSTFNRANIRRILQHIKAFYYAQYDKQVNFRTALFMLSTDQQYLYPFIQDDTNRSKFHFLNKEVNIHQISSNFFSISKNSVAARAWKNKIVLSQSRDIKTVMPTTSKHLQSICCCPLFFHEDVYDYLIDANQKFHRYYGVISVDADSNKVFNAKNHNLNSEIIRTYAKRITYEISLGLYYRFKES